MKLTLLVDMVGLVRWWADGSYNAHKDCEGHTGHMMTLGKGAAISASLKHKHNTKSSTKSKIVSADDALPTVLWPTYFLEAQGYTVEQNILYQDNQSTSRLQVNGRL